jgi:ABC-type nitrate/sulfonate/bicarbonate transport system permease component
VSRRTYSALAVAAEIAVPFAILLLWQAWTVHADSQYFPRLSTILVEFRHLWLSPGQSAPTSCPSLERIGLGLTIAVVAGVGLGSRSASRAGQRLRAMPHIEYWRAMPPPADPARSRSSSCTRSQHAEGYFIAFFACSRSC